MFKKSVALLLVLLTMLPVFAACNKDVPDTTGEGVTTTAPEEDYKLPEYDFVNSCSVKSCIL